jgi:hypothetical protein
MEQNEINHHLQLNQIANIKADQWATDLIGINWKYVITIWLQHNIDYVGSTELERQARRKMTLI